MDKLPSNVVSIFSGLPDQHFTVHIKLKADGEMSVMIEEFDVDPENLEDVDAVIYALYEAAEELERQAGYPTGPDDVLQVLAEMAAATNEANNDATDDD